MQISLQNYGIENVKAYLDNNLDVFEEIKGLVKSKTNVVDEPAEADVDIVKNIA